MKVPAAKVTLGAEIAIDATRALVVAEIRAFKCRKGNPAFLFYDRRGFSMWARADELITLTE